MVDEKLGRTEIFFSHQRIVRQSQAYVNEMSEGFQEVTRLSSGNHFKELSVSILFFLQILVCNPGQ